jgi:uncharacterized protein
MQRMEPTAPRERWLVLDVLRGFALFGVLLGNLYALYSLRWLSMIGPQHVHESTAIDTAAQWFMAMVVESRAQTLLTFMFGLGFAMQLIRADARGEPVLGLYVRRLVVLFAIGALHVTLLWWGDVTWGYAIVGFALLPLRRRAMRTLWIVAAACLAAAIAMRSSRGVPCVDDALFGADSFARVNADTAAAIHGTSHSALALAQIAQGVMWTLADSGAYLLWLLGRFAIGYIAGIRRIFERDGADHLRLFRRILVICGALAACSIAITIASYEGAFGHGDRGVWVRVALVTNDEVGWLAQAMFYVAIVVLLLQRARWRRVLAMVAPVGRMPLTTYVLQSVICTSLFYGWGLHWSTPGDAATLGLAAIIFAVQIALAHLWLRAYRFGPLEWVWRALVYLERPRMRV